MNSEVKLPPDFWASLAETSNSSYPNKRRGKIYESQRRKSAPVPYSLEVLSLCKSVKRSSKASLGEGHWNLTVMEIHNKEGFLCADPSSESFDR